MIARGPFPGMDPWLERSWGDVHTRLVTYACDQVSAKLRPDLIARMQERVYIESPLAERRQIVPDVHVQESRGRRASSVTGR